MDDHWYWYMHSNLQHSPIMTKDEYDDVFFFMTDDVPELQIKLAWLKMEEIEAIAKTKKVLSLQGLYDMMGTNSFYYTQINEAMGYKALNALLNSNAYTANTPLRLKTFEGAQKNLDFRMAGLIQDLKQQYGVDKLAFTTKFIKLRQLSPSLIRKIRYSSNYGTGAGW